MLTRRIIGKILLNSEIAIQSRGFSRFLPIGRPEILAEYLDEWGVDEILLIDRLASKKNETINPRIVETVVKYCRAPLTVGGGISSLDDALRLIRSGADRITINACTLDDIKKIKILADTIGNQAIVASVDCIKVEEKGQERYEVYDHRLSKSTGRAVLSHCKELEQLGAGELCLNSVDRDGAGLGYEIELYRQIKKEMNIPVIASGGFGLPSHIEEVFDVGIDAVAIGNRLNYSEHSVSTIKACLDPKRIRSAGVYYRQEQIDSDGRLNRESDEKLEQMLYKKRGVKWL